MSPPLRQQLQPCDASRSWDGRKAGASLRRTFDQTVELMLSKSDHFVVLGPNTGFTARVDREAFRDMLTRVSTTTRPAGVALHPSVPRPVQVQDAELKFSASGSGNAVGERAALEAINAIFPELHKDPTKVAAMRHEFKGRGPFIIATPNRSHYGVADAKALKAMMQGLTARRSRRGAIVLSLPTKKNTPTAGTNANQNCGEGHTENA